MQNPHEHFRDKFSAEVKDLAIRLAWIWHAEQTVREFDQLKALEYDWLEVWAWAIWETKIQMSAAAEATTYCATNPWDADDRAAGH